jgi:sugar lactone lactonase YvrE
VVSRAFRGLALVLAAGAAYFLAWPVPVDPVAWTPPPAPAYAGAFARNARLQQMESLSIGADRGPESVAVAADGRIYASARSGRIVRLRPDGSAPETWADTGGSPLGIRIDGAGNVLVADAQRGLLRIGSDRTVSVLAAEADGQPILYADDLDVAPDGRIYFSDASTRFGARQWGGSYAASLLEIVEHRGHGRLLVWDPATGRATTLARGITFANGVALAPDASFVLVADTGSYRILRHWLTGPRRGQTETLLDNLPGFPDNITRGLDGRFWVGLIAPRNALVDALADQPFLRKVLMRLPGFLLPEGRAYGHVIAFDASGTVRASLQDPDGRYRQTTSALETADYLYVGSLEMPTIGRLPRARIGLP